MEEVLQKFDKSQLGSERLATDVKRPDIVTTSGAAAAGSKSFFQEALAIV